MTVNPSGGSAAGIDYGVEVPTGPPIKPGDGVRDSVLSLGSIKI